ncbi:TPA: NACHT domain-containing protein [Aeromonas veronii]
MLDSIISKATGGLDGLVDELIKSVSGKLKEKISNAFSIEKLKFFKRNVERIGYVKTILNPDSIVSLNEIFFDKAVSFDGFSIDTFSQLRNKHVLIEGGPGQGKSLFLRKICINEANNSSHIPIFVEFRNLRFESSLRDELISAINELGVSLDFSVFEHLATSGKIILFLDGFDEIPNDKRSKIARELENIARAFPELRIVVTSRPDSGMGSSVYFYKLKIDPMPLSVQNEFIEHIYKSKKQSESINAILKNSTFLSDVTTSPLLLTLFSITYNARQFKPDSLSEFYSLIFPTMLYRHDRMKVGFERNRISGLTDYQMQRLFDSLSFLSLNDNQTRFSASKFRKYLEDASKIERLNENLEDALISDISDITALIVRDGFDHYSYTHKSIQEYFSAAFIYRLSENKKGKFYQMVIDNIHEFRKWQNVLSFLNTIDERNYTKYFLIPYKKHALCLDINGSVSINYSALLNLIGRDSRVKVDENGNIIDLYWGDTLSSVLFIEYSAFAKNVVSEYLKSISKTIAEHISYCNQEDYETFQTFDGYFIILIDHIIKETHKQKEICKKISISFDKSHFKREVLSLEQDLNIADRMTDQILPF